MSSDNFWYVKGIRVYMGDASDYSERAATAERNVERKYKADLVKRHPYHEAVSHEEARKWAQGEYAEYGIYWCEEDA